MSASLVAAVLAWAVPAAGLAPPADDSLTTKFTLAPAAAPIPVLRYELLPRIRDQTPGNAAVGYLRAGVLLPTPLPDPEERQAHDDKLQKWRESPVAQLPREEVRSALLAYGRALRAADAAARCATCDWSMPPTPTIASLELGDIQTVRHVAAALRLRAKLELAERRYDDALRTIQTTMQMGRHVGEGSSLIQYLVGQAIVGLACEQIEDWVRQPDSPNLYWALATLPRPIIDPRPMLDGEAVLLENTLPGLRDFDTGVLTEAEAQRLLDGMRKNLISLDEASAKLADLKGLEGLAIRMEWGAYIAWNWADSKKDLLARGYPAKEVERMPAIQAVFLSAWVRYRELRDDHDKVFLLPPAESIREQHRVVDRYKTTRARGRAYDKMYWVLTLMLPATQRVHESYIRTERRLATLRAVEALRLHAAANGGTWPAKLEEVKAVAVPADPATGEPFAYQVKGDTAILSGPPPQGQAPTRTNALRYELILRPVK